MSLEKGVNGILNVRNSFTKDNNLDYVQRISFRNYINRGQNGDFCSKRALNQGLAMMTDVAFGDDRVLLELDAGVGKADLMIRLPRNIEYVLMELKRDRCAGEAFGQLYLNKYLNLVRFKETVKR